MELGAQVSVAAGAAGGSRCSPGTARSKDGDERGLEKGGIVSMCLGGGGVTAEIK